MHHEELRKGMKIPKQKYDYYVNESNSNQRINQSKKHTYPDPMMLFVESFIFFQKLMKR